MKQQIKALLDEERGVSPVIGVILMVAITVILAAVIGTFVLGLGDSLEQAPQTTLNAGSDASDTVTLSHNGGDALPYADITIQVDNADVTGDFQGVDSNDELGVGDSISVDAGADTASVSDGAWAGNTVTVTVIHNPSESILLDTEVDVQS